MSIEMTPAVEDVLVGAAVLANNLLTIAALFTNATRKKPPTRRRFAA